jgi:redox-sensitive bicupin YhaK (pirin superfamily)
MAVAGLFPTGMSTPRVAPTIRIVPGVVETRNTTTRLILPTPSQPSWPPFTRVGESVVNRGRQFAPHAHEAEEVLTYVTEGLASYQMEPGGAAQLRPGHARLLTTPGRTEHRISPVRGGPIRWFNLVVQLPAGSRGPFRLQTSEPPATPTYEQNALVHRIVGEGSSMASAAGLACAEITFVESSTSFLGVGHDRRGLIYSLVGRGKVDGVSLETGEAALVEGAAGVAVQGTSGLRVIVATAPR